MAEQINGSVQIPLLDSSMEKDICQKSSMDGLTIFKSKKTSSFHRLIVLAIWLGSIHLTVVLVLTAFFFLPATLAFAVFGLLIFLRVIPTNWADRPEGPKGPKGGRTSIWYICKHASGHFPVTFDVEDINAFDPNQAYVFGYEPHPVLPIGVIALGDLTGFMTGSIWFVICKVVKS